MLLLAVSFYKSLYFSSTTAQPTIAQKPEIPAESPPFSSVGRSKSVSMDVKSGTKKPGKVAVNQLSHSEMHKSASQSPSSNDGLDASGRAGFEELLAINTRPFTAPHIYSNKINGRESSPVKVNHEMDLSAVTPDKAGFWIATTPFPQNPAPPAFRLIDDDQIDGEWLPSWTKAVCGCCVGFFCCSTDRL